MLQGLRVLELATYIAAPAAAGLMADWGAEVVKVEPMTGCPMRAFFKSAKSSVYDNNPVFSLDNRGKKGMALDVTSPQGASIIKKMVKDFDVFVTNIRPGGLERAGLDYASLKKINPRLVYTSVSGYGLQGEEKNRPGFDATAFWARSGLASLMTRKGTEPSPLRTAVGDHVTALATTSAILAALVERQKTNKGRLVETSLLRTGIYALGSDMSIQLQYGRVASTKSRNQSINPLLNFFLCKDNVWISLLPRGGDSDWKQICCAIDRPDLVEDERFTSIKLRRTNGEALVAIIEEAFAQHDLATWRQKLDAQDVIWAPVQTPKQVVEDPQAEACGAFVEVMDAQEKPFLAPAAPARFYDYDNKQDSLTEGSKSAAPELGQHNEEILEKYGYNKEDIATLRNKNIIT